MTFPSLYHMGSLSSTIKFILLFFIYMYYMGSYFNIIVPYGLSTPIKDYNTCIYLVTVSLNQQIVNLFASHVTC